MTVKRTDGGQSTRETDPIALFETTSDTEISRSERYQRALDEFVVAPLYILWDDWRSRVGLLIILFYVLMGTVGVVLIDAPIADEGPRLQGVFQTWEFPLGTDTIGQGILAQIVHATPSMLVMIASGAVFTTVMATIFGTVSGYKGGVVDRVLVTITDIMLAIPGLPLVIVIAFLFKPENPAIVGVLVTVNAWAGLARSLRSQVLTLRDEAYVEASRIMGFSSPAIITRDVLPNLMPYILVNFTISARRVIVASVALYFLGILPFSNFNWGVMLNQAYNTSGLYSLSAAHWLLVPTITIVLLTYGLILFGQGADRIFNPRTRVKHTSDDTEVEQ